MPRLQFAARTRAERQQARARLGKLRDNKVHRRTLTKSQQYVSVFQLWVQSVGLAPANTIEILDRQVMEYIEWLWDQGFGKSDAGYTLSALQHTLQVRRSFVGSWGLFKVWSRLELPVRAPPMPVRVAFGLAGACVSLQRNDLATIMVLAFSAMLRTTEFLTLRYSFLHFNYALDRLVIVLPLTKSGQRKGTIEHVVVDDGPVVRLVHHLTQGRCDNALIFTDSPHCFRRIFDNMLAQLGLANLHLRPYSFRRGGATEFFNHSQSMDAVLERGRWGSPDTARIYLTAGLSELNSMNILPRSDQWLRVLVSRLRM